MMRGPRPLASGILSLNRLGSRQSHAAMPVSTISLPSLRMKTPGNLPCRPSFETASKSPARIAPGMSAIGGLAVYRPGLAHRSRAARCGRHTAHTRGWALDPPQASKVLTRRTRRRHGGHGKQEFGCFARMYDQTPREAHHLSFPWPPCLLRVLRVKNLDCLFAKYVTPRRSASRTRRQADQSIDMHESQCRVPSRLSL